MYEVTKEEEFLKKHFREFYKKNKVAAMGEIEKREFGYGVYKRKIANRNLSFQNADAMNKFLIERTPLYFSYSNSCYVDPSASPMKNKHWLKGDIIYEFDADEVLTTCDKISGDWVCNKVFGEESFVEERGESKKQWFLQKSLEETKKQVFRLVDFMESDFGFSKDLIDINFSGKAGYHVHLRNESIQNLNKRARIEMVDYITGYGMYYDNLGYSFDKSLNCSKDIGLWSNRINKGIKEFFNKDYLEIAKITGISKKRAEVFSSAKEEIFKKIDSGLLYDVGQKTNKAFWKSVLDFVVATYMVPIDRQTSVDLHKIIRVPNTLHGETGFIAKNLSLSELETFDPFVDGVVFDSKEIKIFVDDAPKFSLKGQEFGPFKNETVSVPLFCAVYLIGKGAKLKE
jgi:DNA primase small subunit